MILEIVDLVKKQKTHFLSVWVFEWFKFRNTFQVKLLQNTRNEAHFQQNYKFIKVSQIPSGLYILLFISSKNLILLKGFILIKKA